MEKILFKKEVLENLNIPSLPVKEWNGKDTFKDGVAVVSMRDNRSAYAVATFNAEVDKQPRIKKVFSLEPFYDIEKVFVVPSYMDTLEDVPDMDLDNESKEAAKRLAEEAKDLEDEGVESDEMKDMKSLPEWVFDNIHNAEEAYAFVQSYNSRNKIKGRVPKSEEPLKLRLLAIYTEMKNSNK